MSTRAPATKCPTAPGPQEKKKDAVRHTPFANVRWALVLPVDFDGEDTSLTQAQLAVLK